LILSLFKWVILSNSQRPERTSHIHVPVTTMNATINATRIVPCLRFSARHVSYVGPGSQRGLMGCLSGRHKSLKSLGLRLYIAIPTRTHPAPVDRCCQQLRIPLLGSGECWVGGVELPPSRTATYAPAASSVVMALVPPSMQPQQKAPHWRGRKNNVSDEAQAASASSVPALRAEKSTTLLAASKLRTYETPR